MFNPVMDQDPPLFVVLIIWDWVSLLKNKREKERGPWLVKRNVEIHKKKKN